MRSIAMINQKGGVGKTTSAVNISAALSATGRSVCLIDLDPQAHATLHDGASPEQGELSVYDVLTRGARLADACRQLDEHLWIVPSQLDLAAAEVELAGEVGRELILRDRLAEVTGRFDYVIIDCPPSLGLLTINALAAAEELIVPMQTHFLALQGVSRLFETVQMLVGGLNPNLRVTGVVLCMHERNTKLAREVVDDLQGFL